MNNSMKMGLVKATLFSILIAMSGMAAIASADDVPQAPIMFYGTVTLNDADASPGTTIDAYIDGKLCGSIVTATEGQYHSFGVTGDESDDGETITFTVCGATAGTVVWAASTTPTSQELNLSAGDTEAPAVTTATATPVSIVADGVETTKLNVTIIDGCRCTVGTVTVNLSAIGGDEAQEMTRIGDTDVYSVTVTANEGTGGAHCLYVNASDVFGNYNGSVCIGLEATSSLTVLPQTGDIDGSIGEPTMSDAVYLAKHVVGLSGYDTIHADGDIDCSGGDPSMSDAVYLAKHVVGLSGYETIY